MGPRFKTFDDRQFCNGHRTVTEGSPVAYIANGDYAAEENLRTIIEARAQVGGNFLAGVGHDAPTMQAMLKRSNTRWRPATPSRATSTAWAA